MSLNRWMLHPERGIRWDVAADRRLPHRDFLEMSGLKASLIVYYGVDKDGAALLRRDIVWPQLRTIPNDTHASLIWRDAPGTLDIKVDGLCPQAKVMEILFDGILTIRSQTGCGLEVERAVFPSVDKAGACERWTVGNAGRCQLGIEVTGPDHTEYTDPAKGVYGKYRLESRGLPPRVAFTLEPGERRTFGISFTGRRSCEASIVMDVQQEEARRRDLIRFLHGTLRLETPEPVLDREFAMAKVRTSESIFATKGGLTHSPGGHSYYAAIWANDQAEYAGPLFPFIGYATGNEAMLTAYRWFARYMNDAYERLPSSIIAEGSDTWNWKGLRPGDRGDAAMVAYGAARFVMALGDADVARELWPLIRWALEYCRRRLTPEGVVASESDELEGRFPSGNANLCTSSLAYDALRSAALLAGQLGESAAVTEEYNRQADALRSAIDKHFGARVEGFETYRYYEGNDVLRAWICIPLTVGIFDRARGTTAALFSPRLWTRDGLATVAGHETFWDRSTLYGLRGVLAAGETDLAMGFLRNYSIRRLLGDHVPYPVEAYPEGNQRHLAAESALYCRIITEGLFGIRPTGLRSFICAPRLPTGWDCMALRDIKAFGCTFDIVIRRRDRGLAIEIRVGGKSVQQHAFDGIQPIAVDL